MERQAIDAARRLIDAFAGAEVDTVVTNAAGCGSTMKEYAHLLRDDPEYAERARALGAKCRDVSELLAELEPRSPRHSLGAPLRVAYHDACHLQHAQNVRLQPRRLLGAIPQVELVEIADAALCCGSAGIFNLIEPRAGAYLRRLPDADLARLRHQEQAEQERHCRYDDGIDQGVPQALRHGEPRVLRGHVRRGRDDGHQSAAPAVADVIGDGHG